MKQLTPKDLSPEQRTAYKDMLAKKTMCISSDCGFGKTISGLTAFAVLKKKVPESKMLVVCTPQGVKTTWSKEHLKWTHTNKLKVSALLGTPAQRLKKLKEDVDIYAVTYHTLKWLLDSNKGKNKVKFNFVFADEADCLKGSSSKWRSQLLKVAPQAKYRILSSATPKTREEDDYWGLCKYLDDGESLGARTVTEFRDIYCKQIKMGKQIIVYKINPHMIPELEKRIQHLFINYDKSDSATIPVKTITCTAKLTEESAKIYKKLQDAQCMGSIVYDNRGVRDSEKSLNSMTLSAKLAQLSNGFLYLDEDVKITPEILRETTDVNALINNSVKRKVITLFDDRVNLLKKLIGKIHKKHGNVPIVIAYNFKQELVQLEGLLPDGVNDQQPNFETNWNSGKIKYLFLQYSRSSKSLNLQHGGNIIIIYSPTFKWVDDYQIVRRLARQGQKEECVYVYRLYIKGTIDDVKTKRLNERFVGHTRFQNKIIREIKSS